MLISKLMICCVEDIEERHSGRSEQVIFFDWINCSAC